LMPFQPTEAWLEEVSGFAVELPLARKQRFMRDYQLPASDAQTFVWDRPIADYFESIVKLTKNPKAAANWIINNLRAKLTESEISLAELKFNIRAIPELIDLIDSGKISTRIAQDVFAEMFSTGESPSLIVDKRGLAQVSDTAAISQFCEQAIDANPGPVADYKAGK